MTDRVFERLEEAALGALDDYMAYRTYQGENADYYKRARIGIPVLSTYGRVRGTRANERQLDIIERRMASGEVVDNGRPALAEPSSQGLTDGLGDPDREDSEAAERGARGRRRK